MDKCVHCNRPVIEVPTPWGATALVHQHTGAEGCLNGTDRVACLTQAGFE